MELKKIKETYNLKQLSTFNKINEDIHILWYQWFSY